MITRQQMGLGVRLPTGQAGSFPCHFPLSYCPNAVGTGAAGTAMATPHFSANRAYCILTKALIALYAG